MTRTDPPTTTTLWRPTGPVELDLVRAPDRRAWPPRLPEQPIFHPVRQAGGRTILEPRVPAEELAEFNAHIVGRIRLVHEFHRSASR
ncbi:hypothetical protein [Streptomyces beigongshangae]|uniref:hypothetical protein n=1 Tax=Streptomyces beigongshangae TaxID=2841597 RepID=UPI001C8499E4|nr:hypothetical protein [Streptomyces sp. REN17]